MKTIARHGYARTTMAHVAGTAGLSQGIVNFYFDSKESLLYETLVHLAGEYEAILRRALENAGPDPVRALDAMIETDLGPEVCTPVKSALWLAFWAESRGRPTYAKLCQSLNTNYCRQVSDLCTALIEQNGYRGLDPDVMAVGFVALIDGFWADLSVAPDNMDRERAKTACRAYFAGFFPAEFGPLAAASDKLLTRRAG